MSDLPVTEPSAAAYWSAKAGYAPNWYSFCTPYINRRVSGSPEVSPMPWALRHAFGKTTPGHLMEIGCLDGKRLSRWVAKGLVGQASGVDIAAGAIERGRELYGEAIDLQVMDLNDPQLPAATYDVVISNGVLHHLDEIEAAVANIYASLKPGGALLASEFTGPRRYVYSDDEISLINAGQDRLPPELRDAPFHPDQLAGKLAADPSESVSTRVLEPTLAAAFDRLETRYVGGNVLMRALGKRFFAGFNAADPAHLSAVADLEEMDERSSSDATSHNTFFVAYKSA